MCDIEVNTCWGLKLTRAITRTGCGTVRHRNSSDWQKEEPKLRLKTQMHKDRRQDSNLVHFSLNMWRWLAVWFNFNDFPDNQLTKFRVSIGWSRIFILKFLWSRRRQSIGSAPPDRHNARVSVRLCLWRSSTITDTGCGTEILKTVAGKDRNERAGDDWMGGKGTKSEGCRKRWTL